MIKINEMIKREVKNYMTMKRKQKIIIKKRKKQITLNFKKKDSILMNVLNLKFKKFVKYYKKYDDEI